MKFSRNVLPLKMTSMPSFFNHSKVVEVQTSEVYTKSVQLWTMKSWVLNMVIRVFLCGSWSHICAIMGLVAGPVI